MNSRKRGEIKPQLPFQVKPARSTHFAFDFIRIQQVNEHFKATDIPNGQLARLLHQAEVHQGTQGEDSGRLVTPLSARQQRETTGMRIINIILVLLSSSFFPQHTFFYLNHVPQHVFLEHG